MDSLDTVTYMKRISFFFFAILGVAHFMFGMFATSGFFGDTGLLVTRLLYTPFLLASITYAYTILKEHLLINGKKGKALDYVFLILGVSALVFALFLEVYYPDLNPVIL
jgi:hypothetical protein